MMSNPPRCFLLLQPAVCLLRTPAPKPTAAALPPPLPPSFLLLPPTPRAGMSTWEPCCLCIIICTITTHLLQKREQVEAGPERQNGDRVKSSRAAM